MTPFSRLALRLGLGWLLAGVILSGLAQLPGWQSLPLRPVWIHMLVLGWMTQWIFAISIWMFPRSKKGFRERENGRTWGLLAMWNGGLVIRALFEVNLLGASASVRNGALVLSVLLFWIGSVLYVLEIWPRVRVKEKRRVRAR